MSPVNSSHCNPPRVRKRLPPAEREQHIVREAVMFFAEVGFGGDTRELARRVKVTHPLLFRYFTNKDALIERVFQEVYLGGWNPRWELIINDRSTPLEERLIRFYTVYAKTILTYEWVRLFMFAGLKSASFIKRFFALVEKRIVIPICREIRADGGLPGFDEVPLTPEEIELVWGINSGIFYFGVRKHIYGMPLPKNIDALIETEIRIFFGGVGKTLSDLIGRPHIGPKEASRRGTQSMGSGPSDLFQ